MADLHENCNRLGRVLDDVDNLALKLISLFEGVLKATAKEREQLELLIERGREAKGKPPKEKANG